MATKKLKIGILTYHRALNYGAVLQAYALNYYVNSLGYDCEIIDYRSNYIESWYRVFYDSQWHRNIKEFKPNFKVYSKRTRKKLGFYSFIKPYIGKNIRKEQLYTLQDKYDLFLAGSDQIWNTKISGNDWTYLLDFVRDDSKKASYAASIGKKEIPSEIKGLFDRYVSQFEYLSVREKQDVKILKDEFNKKAELCIDPTLLVPEKIWWDISKIKNNKVKYIFIYTVEEPKELYDYAITLAKEYGYKVCVLTYEFRNFGKYDELINALGERLELINDATPQEFLGYVQNAEFVLTNSFHGTIFSIAYNKHFMVETICKSGYVNERASNICELLGLSDRMFSSQEAFENYNNPIDWNKVKDKLNELRQVSVNYLNYILLDRENKMKLKDAAEIKVPFRDKKNCCGCSACYAICPVNAIFMESDDEGFLYPKIKASACIGCGKCTDVCAFKKDQHKKGLFI